VGRAVAPAVLLRKSEAAGEESPSRTGQRWWLTATRGNPRESATENTQPMASTNPRGTGNGEMVRQERTAAPVTAPAGQTPPPARPSMLLLGPGNNSG